MQRFMTKDRERFCADCDEFVATSIFNETMNLCRQHAGEKMILTKIEIRPADRYYWNRDDFERPRLKPELIIEEWEKDCFYRCLKCWEVFQGIEFIGSKELKCPKCSTTESIVGLSSSQIKDQDWKIFMDKFMDELFEGLYG